MADETPSKVEAVSRYLNEKRIEHEVVEHDERFTAAGEARASGIGPEDAAKDLVLRAGNAYVLAVIPASERLDLRKAATEEEIAAEFSQFEVACPPSARSLVSPKSLIGAFSTSSGFCAAAAIIATL